MDTIVKEIKFKPEQISLLKKHTFYGFKNESALIYYALNLFKNELNKKSELEKSADLYAEIYQEDEELKFLTETAINDIEL